MSGWNFTLVGSSFTSGVESLNAPVEDEALVVVDALNNPRLRNIKEKSLRYKFNVIHIPGFLHAVADAISCHSVGDPTPPNFPDDITIMADATEPLNHIFLLQFFLKDIRMAQQDDTQVCTPSASQPLPK